METRQISDNKKSERGAEALGGTVVLPFKRRRKIRPLRALAYLLLLAFFAVCVFTVGQRIGQEAVSKEGNLGEYLIEQGTAGVPSGR